MKPHAFVVMPFGVKPGADGTNIDFNRIYREYLYPAAEAAGLEVFRADEEQRAGDIIPDMFQELLIADLVIADLTIDNPNVWYELGVRHGIRARGVVLVAGGQPPKAFDIYTNRKLCYGLTDGAPDPSTLETDKKKLTVMITETMQSWHERKISPVYYHLPNLQEPDWKTLRIGEVKAFWEQQEAWERRIDLARKSGRIGDLLVLADEAPIAALRAEAWLKAGKALRTAGHFNFALEQLERGLAITPDNLTGLREKGICLQRLALKNTQGHSLDRARDHYRFVLESHPDDPETWALLGRVDKDAWIAAWRQEDEQEGKSDELLRELASDEAAFLRAAIESYAKGYRRNPIHYYSGINALTLMHLHKHLTDDKRYDSDMEAMAGAVRFAAQCEQDEHQAYWCKATLADLEVLSGTPDKVKSAYKEAVAKADKDWFALDSSRAQLLLLKQLGFRPEAVASGITVYDKALEKLLPPIAAWQPQRVLLFSGHMVDAPNRTPPRFPSDKAEIARQKIAETLDMLKAGPDDLALTQGACGGDLLFSEECQRRGTKLQWLQPFEEPQFIEQSVVCHDQSWRERYYAVKEKLTDDFPLRSAPTELGPLPARAADGYAYERCNLWLQYTALAFGIKKVEFICLWNGEGGDGPGGAGHMYNEVKQRTGKVHWLDTRKL